MKVLLLTNLYPFAQAPTRGMYHVSVFRGLTQHCDARVVVPLPWWIRIKRPKEWIEVPRETTTGILAEFPTYWTIPRLHHLHGQAMYQSLKGIVHRIHSEFPFEAILACWAYPDAFAGALLAADYNVPLITNVLGSDINALAQTSTLAPKIKWTLNQSARIVSVSHALKEVMVSLGIPAEKIVVQHNGVDGERFQLQNRCDVRRKLGLPEDRKIILYVGNFVHEKGVDTLVEAAGILAKSKHRNLLLALVGSGAFESHLLELVATLGLEKTVQFCGRKPHHEVPDWMSAADVFCLPSRREGCPNVILEALSSGRPVVASRVGGVPELLDERNGIMVEAGNPESMANGLDMALSHGWSDVELRTTVAGRSWNDVGRNYFVAIRDSVESHKAKKVS